ncbi:MAG: hypothetical protein U9Q81_00140 [Pseudomonadota bacterium]|nr:hypothetical protein [Pseudomonadota bacterium]
MNSLDDQALVERHSEDRRLSVFRDQRNLSRLGISQKLAGLSNGVLVDVAAVGTAQDEVQGVLEPVAPLKRGPSLADPLACRRELRVVKVEQAGELVEGLVEQRQLLLQPIKQPPVRRGRRQTAPGLRVIAQDLVVTLQRERCHREAVDALRAVELACGGNGSDQEIRHPVPVLGEPLCLQRIDHGQDDAAGVILEECIDGAG